ncbi:fec operon regulator FecR [Bremerella volcania]|uniref:Fec operon regulator FecR n=1 Tax=Bremerella volcania TaxID=2527984 RepID=A0A518C2K5_9BACT|nr:FecR domain-containing protein [Bremerella volcania]QDU73460.1 fec operon regulator FecR [Bremerella volcania]
MNDNTPTNDDQTISDDDLIELIVRYNDDDLDEYEMTALSAALEGDDRALELFHSIALQSLTIAEVTSPRHKPAPFPRQTIFWWSAAMALAASVAFAVFLDLRAGQLPTVAKLVQATGKVTVTMPDGEARKLAVGDDIPVGMQITTDAIGSSATIQFPDKTSISLHGATEAAFREEDHKQVDLFVGNVVADVQPQLPGKPLQVITELAVTEVLGTVLSVQASHQQTDVDVVEGKVRVIRTGDRSTINVAAGEKVAVARDLPLKSQLRTPTPDHWKIDFEKELPDDWRKGIWVQEQLPPGSDGAVKAETRPGFLDPSRTWYQIETFNRWSDGLFTVQEDTHMKVAFRVNRADNVQVLLLARGADFQGSDRFYEYEIRDFAPGKSSDWQTLDVPLSAFKRVPSEDATLSPPQLGQVVFKVVLSTQDRDVDLIVDQLEFAPKSVTQND